MLDRKKNWHSSVNFMLIQNRRVRISIKDNQNLYLKYKILIITLGFVPKIRAALE